MLKCPASISYSTAPNQWHILEFQNTSAWLYLVLVHVVQPKFLRILKLNRTSINPHYPVGLRSSYQMNSNLLLCPCGKSFIASGPLKNHQKSCNKAKSRLLEALEKAKESWRPKKRRRLEDLEASNLALATGPADIVEDINIPADIVDAVHVNNVRFLC